MHIDEFDYELPERLIAQQPADKRDGSRLMVLDMDTGAREHRHFYDILEYLHPGDCLVLNDSKVIPARLFGVKPATGAHIEFLLTKRIDGDRWETMVRPGRRVKTGDIICFGAGEDTESKALLTAEVVGYGDDGTRIVDFTYDGIFMEVLEQIGTMPLPPYIDRASEDADKERYQTVYCREEGSVAAPTAGLHFTEELLAKAEAKGVRLAYVTLHVGIGTFRPVKCEHIEDHHMHFEEYEISDETARVINETIASGGKVISVGTTSTRTLESAAVEIEQDAGYSNTTGKGRRYKIQACSGSTDIFIYPGYKFKLVDALITNFHLPKSTLIMLISAFYDRDKVIEAYREAVDLEYRFFSYGDAMLIK